jgi:hypothetical protein
MSINTRTDTADGEWEELRFQTPSLDGKPMGKAPMKKNSSLINDT